MSSLDQSQRSKFLAYLYYHYDLPSVGLEELQRLTVDLVNRENFGLHAELDTYYCPGSFVPRTTILYTITCTKQWMITQLRWGIA